MTTLRLYSIGDVDPGAVQYAALTVSEVLRLRCRIDQRRLDPGEAYLPGRNQYYSTSLLEVLLKQEGPPGEIRLGLTEVDLCIPILTFVFGEAMLRGAAAVVSLHRLRQTFYGLPRDPDLLLRRLEKEILHELGHAAGLIHCRDYRCAMAFSNSVGQVDLKEASFCGSCLDALSLAWPETVGM
jgi:archaemetzincin